MAETVLGYTVKVTTSVVDAYPEMKAGIEEQARQAFEDRYGFQSTSLVWVTENGYIWTDEETGEQIEVPPMSMCLVEGVKQDG